MLMTASGERDHDEFSGSEVEIDSDDWSAVHQCTGFDGDYGLSLLDGAQF
jgi:hypothetical protein